MKRRTFLLGSAVASIGLASGITWVAIKPNKQPLTVDNALQHLEQLIAQKLTTTGEWTLAQIFTHCAQSVEYSMTGFPEHKSDLFKQTVGNIAFSLFVAKGKMSHALNEVIPSAPPLLTTVSVEKAYARFKQSLINFKQYNGALAPHFAYGALSKADYEIAHVMHFNNHLLEINTIDT